MRVAAMERIAVLDPTLFGDFCTEFYFVEESIEVYAEIAGDTKGFRIDALYGPNSGTVYSTQAYTEETVITPQSGDPLTPAKAWVTYDLPWTNGRSADEALGSALSFLRERCRRNAS
jgi:hypothetical protein